MNPSEACGCSYDIEAVADVIIVGGGISGLTSACAIFEAEPSIKIMILESTEVLGGQIYQTYCSHDLGAKFIKKDHNHVIALLEKFCIPTRPREKQENLKDVSTFTSGMFGSLYRLETCRFLRYVNLIAKEYQYGHFKIVRTKGNSMENLINRKLLFPKSKRYARLVVRLVCGVDAENTTVSEFLAACLSCGSSNNVTDLYFGEFNDVLEVDTNALLEKLTGIVYDHVLVKTKTRVIEVFFSGEQYLIRDSLCRIYKSTVLVLAIPWNSVMRLDIYPVLPLDCRIPSLRHMNLLSSFCATYEQSLWRDLGYSGSFILDGDQPMICFETKPCTICGVILHDKKHTDAPIDKASILERLKPYFGEGVFQTYSFAVRYFEQGSILNHPQLKHFHNLILASSCGSFENRGLLSGSIEGGLRAAIHVIKILKPDICGCEEEEEEEEEVVIEKAGMAEKFFASLNFKEGFYLTIALVASLVTYKVVSGYFRSK